MDRDELGERAVAYNKGWEMGFGHGARAGRIQAKREQIHHDWSRLTWTVIACAFIGCLLALLAYTAYFMMI